MHPARQLGAQRAPRRLQNARDVGGIALADGQTRRGVLYRSDAPQAGDDPPAGLRWPPATVIDLRSGDEKLAQHPLAELGSDVHAIPLIRQASIVQIAETENVSQMSLPRLYRRTLDDAGASFARIATLIATAPTPLLVHCAAGKDRTGLVIAVVLSALGAAREQVIADYVRTQANMAGVLARIAATPGLQDAEQLLERMAREQPEILSAPPAAIALALDLLEEHGGSAAWLSRNGLSAQQLAQLRSRLRVPT